MAHPINDKLNRIEKRKAVVCNDTCVHWRFPHLDNACVLSDVFSVKKGQPCFEYKQLKYVTIKLTAGNY